jgi:hypothetical protein
MKMIAFACATFQDLLIPLGFILGLGVAVAFVLGLGVAIALAIIGLFRSGGSR